MPNDLLLLRDIAGDIFQVHAFELPQRRIHRLSALRSIAAQDTRRYRRAIDHHEIEQAAAGVRVNRADMVGDFAGAVRFRAAEQVNDLLPLSRKDLAAFEGPRRAFQKAYETAQVSVNDLDFAEVHDCFTIAELLTVEAMGMCEPGGGRAVVREGQTEWGGKLPINLSGGLKAKGHPVGATGVSMHVLAARQLTGRAGEMQLPNAGLGLIFNMGGGAVANCVSILERVHN